MNPTLKAIVKYRKDSSFNPIGNLSIMSHFEFTLASNDDEPKSTDVLLKVLKCNVSICADYIY